MRLGINVNPAIMSFAEIDALRVRMVRFPLWADLFPTSGETLEFYQYVCAGFCKRGIDPLVVLDSRSWAGGAPWMDWGSLPFRYVQMGNEPDLDNHISDSSSTQSVEEFAADLVWARENYGSKRYIIAGGLASGHPEFLDGVDLTPVDAIAVHPYGRRPGDAFPDEDWFFGTAEELIDGYRRFQKPIWVTEFGASRADFLSEEDRAAYLTLMVEDLAHLGAVHALWYCAVRAMNENFGLEDEDRRAFIQASRRYNGRK